eukprot:555982-Amphidinium_carterae.1
MHYKLARRVQNIVGNESLTSDLTLIHDLMWQFFCTIVHKLIPAPVDYNFLPDSSPFAAPMQG